MKLSYTAYDKNGQQVTATLDAATAAEASEALRRKGLYVTNLAEVAGGAPRARGRRRRGRGSRLKNLTMFTRQLYVLVSSGTPLVEALKALERQMTDGAWCAAIADIRLRIEEGSPLAEALRDHGEYFDTIYCSLIAAGESSGNVAAMLERLAKLTQKRAKVRNAIIGALIYPILLTVVAVSVLTLMLAFVVPRFSVLFETLDVPLPGTTKALIGLSDALRNYGWLFLAVLIGGAAGLKMWLRTPAAKSAIDSLAIQVPVFGKIVRNFVTARIARLIGLLQESHVPILEALQLTREGAGNRRYAELIQSAEEAVTRGDPISSAFAQSDLISPTICEALRNGEQSGQVGSLLLNVAEFLDEENEVSMRALTSIIEPFILIFMGLLVGFVAISMFLPLFDLTAMT